MAGMRFLVTAALVVLEVRLQPKTGLRTVASVVLVVTQARVPAVQGAPAVML